MLIDVSCYQPELITTTSVVPASLHWDETPDWVSLAEDLLEQEEAVEVVTPALKGQSMPRGSRFEDGPFLHLQFDGGSCSGIGSGGFVIVDPQGEEIMRGGAYFGPGHTNNEAEARALA